MIEEILLKTRARDGVNVYTRHSTAYVEISTHKYFSEIPEGREEADFATTFVKVRNDQTGVVYDIAHDVEGAPYTYTEVFPDPNPELLTEWEVVSSAGIGCMAPRYYLYPAYNAQVTYYQGDRVNYNDKTYECEEEELTGWAPDVCGWNEILPYVEYKEYGYLSLAEIEELYPDDAPAEVEP